MAKAPRHIPFLIGGIAEGMQLVNLMEGMYNAGVREFRISGPPDPAPDPGIAPLNGQHAGLLPAPRKGPTSNDVLRALAASGEPFGYTDIKSGLIAKGYHGNTAGNVIDRGLKQKLIKRIGVGQYRGTGALRPDEAPATPSPPRSTQSTMALVTQWLREAHPNALLARDVRARLTAMKRRAATSSVALNWLKKRKHAKRGKRLGEWLYVPPKHPS